MTRCWDKTEDTTLYVTWSIKYLEIQINTDDDDWMFNYLSVKFMYS